MTSGKPLDFGADGITGSIDEDGRIIALNLYHPEHGYITLTAAHPFPEHERYNQLAVRAYRASLAKLHGFGFHFDEPLIEREITLLESVIPRITLKFQNGGTAEVLTFAHSLGALQIWDVAGVKPHWQGHLCLQRCAYTQLTEGGFIPMPPLAMKARVQNDLLMIENPNLPAVVAIIGWGKATKREYESTEPLDIALAEISTGQSNLIYGFGLTIEDAIENARKLQALNPTELLNNCLTQWHNRWQGITDDLLVRRGLAYSLMLAVPTGESTCLLTDHMLLPLAWNRDSYYTARALLSWRDEMGDVVRRHLLWMFETAERTDGAWGRCYMANGRIKDGAFQLDQQLYPLLELSEYTLETGDNATFERLKSHVQPLIESLLQHKSPDSMLFPTDETPGDDPIALPYHLSSHILFWYVLQKLIQLGFDYSHLASQLRTAIEGAFIAEYNSKRIFAYATDGKGAHHFYHDANDLPLALAPIWGFVTADDLIWRATLDFAFSDANVGGSYNGRLGSVHTRAAWPLGDVQDLIIARITGDKNREQRAYENLRAAAQVDGGLPEACDTQSGEVVSRHWFAWPSAALACVALGVYGL